MNHLLKNKLFISTRPKGQSDELNRLLKEAGAETVEMPLIEIRPASLSEKENDILEQLEQFQWLVFTSPNGVRYFFEVLEKRGIANLPEKIQIAVIGQKTEEELNFFGYSPAFVNPGNTGEHFAAALLKKVENNSCQPRILLTLGNLARAVIQDELSRVAACMRLNVYKTVIPDLTDEKTVQLIKDNRYEMLIFTSPSAIQNFMKRFNDISAKNIRLACIGETTASEARKQGIQPLVVAKNASAQGIVESIIQYYS
ncbi:uroporphyrinogen-III synthase [Maribellus maritimus]|uniref:uroporphyrinogen-III synthase n=1 Tax=Maribellus maritimus TaxID=2870838 RepID=UPI001EE9E91A|nr:uroporphyrinogen-III synthase [Maribellus maritimus]MCG6187187.1 uroporphyrinogen-III synthase [Maribellus maritimus]